MARDVGRAFDAALAQAGGSRPTWLVLLSLKTRPTANQRELAAAVGIQDATLTHHLNGMESDGLLTRRRDPANRRVHVVELTPAGKRRSTASAPSPRTTTTRLRTGFTEAEMDVLRALLGRLRGNVADTADATP